MHKLTHFAALAGLAGISAAAFGDEVPASLHSVTANVGVVSNYIYRGLTQTWDKPALQGGVDYAHANGVYAGLWASNVTDKLYAGGGTELDYYFGYNGKINDDWGWTAGFFGWYYPGANFHKFNPSVAVYGDQDYNNQELNVGVSYKWFSAKISSSLTNYFGANTKSGYTSGSKGTTYLDLNLNVPLPEETFGKDVVLGLHYGYTDYKTNLAAATNGGAPAGSSPDYSDYKISLSKTFDGNWVGSLAYYYADNGAVYNRTMSANSPMDVKDLGGSHWVVSVVKNF